jgi:hypothetical protein
MKIKIKSGYECRGSEFENGYKEFEVEKFDLKEVLKKCLVLEFGSEENCVEYWSGGGYNGIKKGEGMNEIVKYILEINESDKKNEYWEGEWMMSEESFVKIFIDGKLFLN